MATAIAVSVVHSHVVYANYVKSASTELLFVLQHLKYSRQCIVAYLNCKFIKNNTLKFILVS